MGGHQSKQTVDDTLDISTSSTANNSNINAITVSSSNTGIISGDSNIVSGVTQTVEVTITADVWSNVKSDTDLQTSVSQSMQQKIEDKSVAMTQFLDKSKTDISNIVNNHVTQDVTVNNITKCTNAFNQSNTLIISGSNNYVKNYHQAVVATILADCSMDSASTQQFGTTMTTALNQYSSSVSENPFAFITDTIQTIAKSGMMLIAVIFIALICFVLLFKLLHKPKTSDNVQYIQVPQQDFAIPQVPVQ